MVWDAGYTFDCDQLAGRHGLQGAPVLLARDVPRAAQARAQARRATGRTPKGIKAHLHSCGDVTPLVPELIEIGMDALNPLEVKAGMDPLALKREFGDRLVLHGGINAVLWTATASGSRPRCGAWSPP